MLRSGLILFIAGVISIGGLYFMSQKSKHHHTAQSQQEHSDETLNDISIDTAYAFATAPSQKNGAAFGRITNNTDRNRTITDIHSDVANRTEIHEMAMADGIMKMRKLKKLDIPANEHITLEPGGNHIMFLGLKARLQTDIPIELSLEFSDGTQQDITIPVVPAGQKPEAQNSDAHHKHMDHK